MANIVYPPSLTLENGQEKTYPKTSLLQLDEGDTELAKAKFAQAIKWDASVVFWDEGL